MRECQGVMNICPLCRLEYDISIDDELPVVQVPSGQSPVEGCNLWSAILKDKRSIRSFPNQGNIGGVTIHPRLEASIDNAANDALVAQKCQAVACPVIGVDARLFETKQFIDQDVLLLSDSRSNGCLLERANRTPQKHADNAE